MRVGLSPWARRRVDHTVYDTLPYADETAIYLAKSLG